MKHKIGTQFVRRQHSKINRIETIIDYHVTRNIAGEIVKERYVTSHPCMAQEVIDYDVVQTTIDMAEIIHWR